MALVSDISFGLILKGSRLRWYYSKEHGGFFRVSMWGTRYRVECAPCTHTALTKGPQGREYVVFSHGTHVNTALDLALCLRRLRAIKKPFTVYVDEQGAQINVAQLG